jgi:hypothetical protein
VTQLLSPHPEYLIISFQSEKILVITNAAGADLEPIWANLLAKALEGKNIKELLSNISLGGGAPAVGANAIRSNNFMLGKHGPQFLLVIGYTTRHVSLLATLCGLLMTWFYYR